ncbi:MAG: hypothetical protein JRN45_00250 [Nitrososphaerota archaeon]|nr:hypothetical protein [Nitrososphaerota archaeon]
MKAGEYFDLDYVPDRLLIRDAKAQELLSGTYPKIIFGKSDTGKTVTARWMAAQGVAAYLKCSSSLRSTLSPVLGRVAFNGELAARAFFSAGVREPVIFDEVNALAKYRKSELDDALKMLVDDYPDRKCVFITKMKPEEFFHYLRGDVANRYKGCEAITFEDYDIAQAGEILAQRFSLAGLPSPDRYTLDFLAKKYNAGTPLREVFRILRSLISSSRPVTLEAVEDALKEGVIHDYLKDFQSMSVPQACLLGSVAKCQAVEADAHTWFGTEPPASRPRVYELYNTITKRLPGGQGASPRTVDGLIEELEGMLYIRTESGMAAGGRGRTTYVTCSAHYNTVLRSFGQWTRKRFGIEDAFSEGGSER